MEDIKFLDYKINIFNAASYTLFKDDFTDIRECYLGEFESLDDAKKAALVYFMAERPKFFSKHLYNRIINKKGIQNEYLDFIKVLYFEKIPFPKELLPSNDNDNLLTFNGELI